MKRVVEVAKVIQFGAGASVVLAPMFIGKYDQRERMIVEIFLLICVILVLACPVLLWLLGEKKRAWQGLLVTIVLVVIVAGLSAPQVIR